MSFLVGTAVGGLTAAAVYYGFSRTFETRANTLSTDLHALSTELLKTPVPGPIPASARIHRSPFRDMVQQRWNQEIENAIMGAYRFGNEWDWKQQFNHLKNRVSSMIQ
ncbi:hypothetical protein RSOLAG22IIIB_09812 [Rhizoctonia solani]|uniref:MICOS complex subunit MIC12 n=1 Tax=Rhizoctonia solani TaxID=456999 RepID=A0A0K6FZR1_9AGAM|nr:unnamed protein product [Rhizoctonia solani]CUA71765.1 hypothetical protein RSOLAG22IIIB_09812 [Rhizoctonia solani]